MEPVLYTVVEGNTLWGIANFFGTTVEEIINLNDLTEPELIYPGQKLKIPVDRPYPPRYYAVRPADTLWSIAQRYSTTVNNLLELNNLGNPNLIYPGQILRLRA
ncbi:MAG: LysM peptidoglycan-binding domain-containing protein [Ruminococcaceae bacterium]|nr:LysM peptidoglycan-binding domain-containing protein [Oscillospiraceae bacterium]